MASITKRTNKKGEVVYRLRAFCGTAPDGKQQFRSITWRPSPDMTSKQAEKEAQRQAFLLDEQIAAELKRGLTGERIKFKELADEWFHLMEQTGDMKPSSIVRLKSCRERLYPVFGSSYVDDITYRQVQQFILSLAADGVNQRTGKGLSEKSQKHYITLISDVLRYAKKCGFIADNPCKDVSVVKSGHKEREPYTLDEEVALLEQMQCVDAPLKYQVFFRLMIYCGMRRGEALGLEWSDIDLETGVCSISRTSIYQNAETGTYTSTPKTKSSNRSLRLPQELVTLLRRYKLEQNNSRVLRDAEWRDNERLFTALDGSPMHPNRPYNWLQKFCRREGIPFKGLHSFRHAFASEMIVSGQVDVKTVSAILGHSQTSTTLNIYAHEIQAASAHAMDVVSDLIQAKRKQA